MQNPIISGSGIRGVFGSSLTVESALRFSSAFGALCGGGAVVVGRDTRSSGPAVESAVVAGLCAVGCHPVLLGVAPTPTIQLEVIHSGARGGIAVTSSHNPGEWNALKLIGSDGVFLRAEARNRLLASLEVGSVLADYRTVGRPAVSSGAVERHARLAASLPLVLPGRRLRAVLDTAGGTGGLLGPPLMEHLGVDWTVINDGMRPDGSFPRVAEPTAENLDDLCRAVVERGADLGFAFDPDGDRLALVDENGRAVGEEYTVALALDFVLARRPGPAVVNLSTSMLSQEAAERHGCPLYRSPVGEVSVVEEMERRGATIGGEGNGGVIDAECHPGRDSAVAMAYVVSALRQSGSTLSELVDSFPRFFMVKRRLVAERPFSSIAEALAGEFGAPDDGRDGLWYARPGGWMHVRPSGTEPVVRYIAENRNPGVPGADFARVERIVSGRCAE